MRERGLSFFEMVVALAVVAIILVALVSLATASIRNASFSRNKALASRYTQEVIEWLRGERDTDWDSFSGRSTIAGQPWCFPTQPPDWSSIGECSSSDVIENLFTRQGTLFREDASSVRAEVVTFWDDAQGEHEVRSSTIYTNWNAQ